MMVTHSVPLVCGENLVDGCVMGLSRGILQAGWMKSLLKAWQLIAQCSAGNVAKTATWMHSTNLAHFYPTPSKA